jgi:hypothetical protein
MKLLVVVDKLLTGGNFPQILPEASVKLVGRPSNSTMPPTQSVNLIPQFASLLRLSLVAPKPRHAHSFASVNARTAAEAERCAPSASAMVL